MTCISNSNTYFGRNWAGFPGMLCTYMVSVCLPKRNSKHKFYIVVRRSCGKDGGEKMTS